MLSHRRDGYVGHLVATAGIQELQLRATLGHKQDSLVGDGFEFVAAKMESTQIRTPLCDHHRDVFILEWSQPKHRHIDRGDCEGCTGCNGIRKALQAPNVIQGLSQLKIAARFRFLYGAVREWPDELNVVVTWSLTS